MFFAILIGVALTVFLSSNWAISAEFFQYTDRHGVIHFSNAPTHSRYQPLASFPRQSKLNYRASQLRPWITTLAQQYQLDPTLVTALIQVESDFNSSALSPKGARGLMQLMPGTAQRYDVGNPFDPQKNIEGGIKYLRDLLIRFDGNLSLALAAYNAGELAVEKYGGIPPYPETVAYVEKILLLLRSPETRKDQKIYRLMRNGVVVYTNFLR
ncbi:MAG: lytic transglycosylase domain-containing protein [Candidatus Tectomicrobia bacterium]|nr:lytic transglycosylase domain-containing protein [Candidatus Tectomicrobia bacterium]